MKYYAGIGSRETPKDVCLRMTQIAQRLSSLGYCLRSGGAEGADEAFEFGAKHKQIYLPWSGFNGKKPNDIDYVVPPFRFDLVEKYHPKPSVLSDGGRKLMSRNSYQVLGPNLDDPVDFVLCWTVGGKLKGGTAQALRIAKDYKIPVFNFGEKDGFQKFSSYMTISLLTS